MEKKEKNQTIVVAIGGNAILSSNQKGTVQEQILNIKACSDQIIDLIFKGFNVVITHGNGPQVGNLLLQNEAGKDIVPPNSLDVCGAQSQGSLGYLLTQTIRNRMVNSGIKRDIACILTQVIVDAEDPGFKMPSKPIGPFYTKQQAEEAKKQGFEMVEDSGRGYRRVVPSPHPISIVEKNVIQALSLQGVVVVAVGGGGIPVLINAKEDLVGTEAVVDKDLASALLAYEIGADKLLILTEVEYVALDFGKSTQRRISKMTVEQAKNLMEEGQFPPGSMGPKIMAAIKFVEATKKEAIITSISKISDALAGTTGTRVYFFKD